MARKHQLVCYVKNGITAIMTEAHATMLATTIREITHLKDHGVDRTIAERIAVERLMDRHQIAIATFVDPSRKPLFPYATGSDEQFRRLLDLTQYEIAVRPIHVPFVNGYEEPMFHLTADEIVAIFGRPLPTLETVNA